MTITPIDLQAARGPRYLAIADAIAEQVASGALPPGARLPTHRELAWQASVTVGTVTRAYAELERRGLTVGEVGRGTFVKGPRTAHDHAAHNYAADLAPAEPGTIELSLCFPPRGAERDQLGPVLRALAADPKAAELLEYQPHGGREAHRRAGAAWIGLSGYQVDADRVMVTAGAQHGILVALAAATRPGQRIAAEALTYPGMTVVARMLGLAVEPLAIDGEGLRPEAVEAACRGGIRTVYCMPTLHNPTTAVMPAERRRAVAEVARRHGATLVEDDLFGLFRENAPPPLAQFAPERTIYLTSLSKSVAPGLRVGYLAAPDELMEPARGAIRASCWMAPPLTAEVAARWIADGTAQAILDSRRQAARDRLELARAVFAGRDADAADGALHLWLRLPAPWEAEPFVAAARQRGVAIAAHTPFALAGADLPQAVRICLGPPPSRALLETGLRRLAGLLDEGPGPAPSIV